MYIKYSTFLDCLIILDGYLYIFYNYFYKKRIAGADRAIERVESLGQVKRVVVVAVWSIDGKEGRGGGIIRPVSSFGGDGVRGLKSGMDMHRLWLWQCGDVSNHVLNENRQTRHLDYTGIITTITY